MIYLPNKGKRGRMVSCQIRKALGERGRIQCIFFPLRELASEEPSESGRTSVRYTSGNIFLYGGDVLPRSCNAIEGASKTWLVKRGRRKVRPTALEAEGTKLAQRNLTVGQHDGSVISCVGTDRDLRLYVRLIASYVTYLRCLSDRVLSCGRIGHHRRTNFVE